MANDKREPNDDKRQYDEFVERVGKSLNTEAGLKQILNQVEQPNKDDDKQN